MGLAVHHQSVWGDSFVLKCSGTCQTTRVIAGKMHSQSPILKCYGGHSATQCSNWKNPPLEKTVPFTGAQNLWLQISNLEGVHRKMVITTVYLRVRCMSLTWNLCVTLTLRLFYLRSKILTGAQKTLTGALRACKICVSVRIFAHL